MRFRFQSFFDVSTSATSMQVLQFSVGGRTVLERCRHLFGAYKYFKLGKISVKMVPASTLPVDPLQLSYDTTDPQSVDPRDQMNPGLVRITNGEDIFTDISSLTANQQEQVYQAMMLDPRWSKFMLQSGFRRMAYPLYWQIGQLSQDKFPGATDNVPLSTVDPTIFGAGRVWQGLAPNGSAPEFGAGSGSSPRGLFQVGHKGRLGFLPTDYYQIMYDAVTDRLDSEGFGANNIPEVKVITCVLPKAYKTLYFYRIYVTEEVIFSGLRAAPPAFSRLGDVSVSVSGIDQFLVGTPTPIKPGSTIVVPPAVSNNGSDLP